MNIHKNKNRDGLITNEKREESANINVVKSFTNNILPIENSEFKNKRVPLDGIELLLNRDKVPDSLGKKMDKKNVQETSDNSPRTKRVNDSSNYVRDNTFNDDPLSDLDDIISDAESLNNKKNFQPVISSRKDDRNKRRFIKKRINTDKPSNNFIPRSNFESKKQDLSIKQSPININDDKTDNVSEIVSDDDINNIKENKEGSGESLSDSQYSSGDEGDTISSVSGESQNSQSTYSENNEDNIKNNSNVPNFNNTWKSPSSMSKEEINSEKMDLLYKYSRLEGNGYKSGLNLNMNTKLETLRNEVTKLARMRNVQMSIRTQRKFLISFASGSEYVNKKYNPYKFALDGWSGDVLENIGDYDEVFEELHDKYKDTVQMSPEMRLLTMVGGSGLMFHLSNTLFKSSTPQLNDILQNNPDIMAQIQKAALGSMANANATDPIFGMMMDGINEKKHQQSQQQQWTGRKGYAPPRTTQGFPQPSNVNSSLHAEVNQVPQGQGIFPQQSQMQGPQGFDDILNQLNNSKMGTSGLISDVEEDEKVNTKEVNTKQKRQRQSKQSKQKSGEVIDLDL